MSHKPAPPRLVADPETSLAEAMDAAPRYEAVTKDITISVRTFWLEDQSQPEDHHYAWAYHIRIENGGDETVQLLSRSWEITDGRGKTDHVHGEGVVGEQPILVANEAFEYTSGAALPTPCGFMRGFFHMIIPATSERFEATVPAFSLDSPHRLGLVH
ncbi:Co2+/Mg2+ efflux protein ApaG [Asaia platycodi]|uniref:Co2+/Mg2+ efflux protein ApaG n=1 Tax=Asaia platycodi TaxID=610243 RepID=UPI0004707446|nr:Co2+/Mg2+ efflux protein ApaG [Asaia platycodi]